MSEASIKKLCSRCLGSGVDDNGPEPVTCSVCSGGGYSEAYLIADPPNVFRSYLVLECLDETEYDALSDSNKASLQFLLQCGFVDLNDGKAGKVRLWNWFGAESTTVANLTTLLE